MIAYNPVTGLWETVCRGADDDGIWHGVGTVAQLRAGGPSVWWRIDTADDARTPGQPSIAIAPDGSAVIECISEDRIGLYLAERVTPTGPFDSFVQLAGARAAL
jgi:hypothetical protein